MLRKLIVAGALLGAAGGLLGAAPAEAQTTNWSPVVTSDRSAACAWEWGGVVEAVPARCDDVGEVTLPSWLLVAAGLQVFAVYAGLIMAFRR